MNLPYSRQISRASSMVTSFTGMKGTTSTAPMRGWAPVCLVMSMSSTALADRRLVASSTARGSPLKVKTVRLWSASEEISIRSMGSPSSMASRTWSIRA